MMQVTVSSLKKIIPKPFTDSWQNLRTNTVINIMKHHLYLTVRLEVESQLGLLATVAEIETQTQISVACTANVQVLEVEILKTGLPPLKTKDNGTQH